MSTVPHNTPEKVDYLDEDILTVPGQVYALVSIVSPTGNQRNDRCGMKIRGVFSSKEDAHVHVQRLRKVDTTFDIYLVEMYKWLQVPPDPNAIEDQNYQEEYLQNLIKGYKENQLLAKQHFQERKQLVMEEGLDKHLLPHERLPRPEPIVEETTTATADTPEQDATTSEGPSTSNA